MVPPVAVNTSLTTSTSNSTCPHTPLLFVEAAQKPLLRNRLSVDWDGVNEAPIIAMVDNNNMAKHGPGSSIREDGKLIKPPGHKPPDIAGELKRQSEEAMP